MARQNGVLHCCVIHERDLMFRHLTANYAANPWAENVYRDTPLLLATKVKSAKMLSASMEAMKVTLWVFGPVACVHYPLWEICGRSSRTCG